MDQTKAPKTEDWQKRMADNNKPNLWPKEAELMISAGFFYRKVCWAHFKNDETEFKFEMVVAWFLFTDEQSWADIMSNGEFWSEKWLFSWKQKINRKPGSWIQPLNPEAENEHNWFRQLFLPLIWWEMGLWWRMVGIKANVTENEEKLVVDGWNWQEDSLATLIRAGTHAESFIRKKRNKFTIFKRKTWSTDEQTSPRDHSSQFSYEWTTWKYASDHNFTKTLRHQFDSVTIKSNN